jgi:hypothetical protein
MLNDQDILDAYNLAAEKDETHPKKLPPVRVIKIDCHTFIQAEIESKGQAFLLQLAEAFPGPNGKPAILLQTAPQITAQVRAFVDEKRQA